MLFFSFSCKKQVKDIKTLDASLSGNNYLKHISFSSDVKGFVFSPENKNYEVELLSEDTEEISVFAFPQDDKAIVTVSPNKKATIASGASVKFTITCIAQNKEVRKTIVTVKRRIKGETEVSNNAFLRDVSFSNGRLMQKFKKKKVDGYLVLLDASSSFTQVQGIPEDDRAEIEYDPSSKIEVDEGEAKEVKLTVKATDGSTTKQYKFTIKRESTEDEPYLIDIIVGNGEKITPTFNQNVLQYSCNIANDVEKVKVQGIALNKNATVKVDPEGEVQLDVDVQKTFTIKVSLSSNPSQNNIYTVKVKREKAKNKEALLNSLLINTDEGKTLTLKPAFSSNVKEYEVQVNKNYTGVLNVIATPKSNLAKVKTFTSPVKLGSTVGSKMTIKCTCIAEAGNMEVYTVVASRSSQEDLSKDATLKSLVLKSNAGEVINFTPSFSSNQEQYSATVPYNFKDKVEVSFQTNHAKAVATVSKDKEDLPQSSGATQKFTITVKAEDVSVVKNYVVTVTRLEANNDADLKSLKLKVDESTEYPPLNPAFKPNITEYTATVPYSTKTVRFVFERKEATSTTNPSYPMDPVPYTPHTEANPFVLSVTVQAQSGATKTYSVKISSPTVDDKIKMIPIITESLTVTGTESEGVFITGRTVTIPAYKMSETEITYILFKQVADWAKKNGFSLSIQGIRKGNFDEEEDEPACNVKWSLAVVWCNAYSKMMKKDPCYTKKDGGEIKSVDDVDNNIVMNMDKNGYRLPLEVEWELAARGGNPNAPEWKFKWAGVTGDPTKPSDLAKIEEYLWWKGNSKVYGNPSTHPPKGKKPTNAGKADSFPKIYDLSGNIAEWVWDREGKITKDTPLTGNEEKTKRIVRGGFCFNLIGGSTGTGEAELARCTVFARNVSFGINKSSWEQGFRIVCKN